MISCFIFCSQEPRAFSRLFCLSSWTCVARYYRTICFVGGWRKQRYFSCGCVICLFLHCSFSNDLLLDQTSQSASGSRKRDKIGVQEPPSKANLISSLLVAPVRQFCPGSCCQMLPVPFYANYAFPGSWTVSERVQQAFLRTAQNPKGASSKLKSSSRHSRKQ